MVKIYLWTENLTYVDINVFPLLFYTKKATYDVNCCRGSISVSGPEIPDPTKSVDPDPNPQLWLSVSHSKTVQYCTLFYQFLEYLCRYAQSNIIPEIQ
jgi:hypothetical protein